MNVVDRARNRVDALFGVVFLASGSSLNDRLPREIHGDDLSRGGGPLGDSPILLAVAMGIAIAAWWLLHRQALKAVLIGDRWPQC